MVLGLKHCRAEHVCDCKGRYRENCCRFAVRREWKGVALFSFVIVTENGKQYLTSLSMEGAALVNIVLKGTVAAS